MPQYRICLTEDYLVECAQRYRTQSPNRIWVLPLKAIGFLGLAGLTVVGISAKSFSMAAIPGFFLLLLLAGPRFDYWLMKRRFRRSPFRDDVLLVDLSEAGYKSEANSGKAEIPWRTFTKGRRFDDGFLLFIGQSQFHWWPDSALIEGSASDVDKLLRMSEVSFAN